MLEEIAKVRQPSNPGLRILRRGKDPTAVNLAAALAMRGRKTPHDLAPAKPTAVSPSFLHQGTIDRGMLAHQAHRDKATAVWRALGSGSVRAGQQLVRAPTDDGGAG